MKASGFAPLPKLGNGALGARFVPCWRALAVAATQSLPRTVRAAPYLLASLKTERSGVHLWRLPQLGGAWFLTLLFILLPGAHGLVPVNVLQALERGEDLVAGFSSMGVVNGSSS